MQKKLIEITFEELHKHKDRMRVGTDDHTIYALDTKGLVYVVVDKGADEVSSSMWEFLGIEAKYLDEEILDLAISIEERSTER